jgi:hypothetical protein
LFSDYSSSFLDSYDLIRGDSLKCLNLAIGPAQGQVHRNRFADTEMKPEIALRNERPSTANLINLRPSA